MSILLAGPILKCSTDADVSVWLLMSKKCDIQLRICRITAKSKGRDIEDLVPEKVSIDWVEVAPTLWIALVAGSLARNLRLSEKDSLGYKIASNEDAVAKLLEQRHLALSRDGSEWLSLPVRTKETGASLIACSCRSLSTGSVDAVRGLHPWIRGRSDAGSALGMLLLGDQIYADQSRQLLPLIEQLATTIFPSYKRPKSADQRKELSVRSGFTTGNPEQQLICFEEFFCHYILAWSSLVWPKGRLPPDVEKRRIDVLLWESVLANVPVAMLCDDHEITDDWFFDDAWQKRVLATPDGSRIVASGMLAIAALEMAGCNGEMAASHLRVSLGLLMEKKFSDLLAMMLKISWSYRLRFGELQLLCVDTRTSREVATEYVQVRVLSIDEDGQRPAPKLRLRLVSKAQEQLIARWLREPIGSRDIIATPSPLFGMPTIERLQASLPALMFDREGWGALPLSWLSLARALDGRLRNDTLVVISGDVHYSFVAEAEIISPSRTTKILQITASPICNELAVLSLLDSAQVGSGPLNAWHSEGLWVRNDLHVDYLQQFVETDATLAQLDIQKKKRAGLFYLRRWRVIGAAAGIKPRPISRANFCEVRNSPSRVQYSFRDEGMAELQGGTYRE